MIFRRSGASLHSTLIILLIVGACLIVSCKEKAVNPNGSLTMDYYTPLRSSGYIFSGRQVDRELRRLASSDSDTLLADYYARSFYIRRRGMIWLDRKGADSRADSVLSRLRTVSGMGFNPSRFRLPQIEADLARVRRLDFDDGSNRASKVFARLEYNLTKAYFRFAAGQQFGYTNPNMLLNRLDTREDSHSQAFVSLYGYKGPRQGKRFYEHAVDMAGTGRVGAYLDSISPDNPTFSRLKALLNSGSCRRYGRRLVMVNMERCRWRMTDWPHCHKKYVLVNIPSFHLIAVDGDRTLTMRIGCGSLKTKTPLLNSSIVRMDINPQWIMPRSIVRKSIIPHLGNAAYFASHHYFIRDRSTGGSVEPWRASRELLESGDLLAIQEGGEGNALGRVIFRFDNDFSIYLHDTSSKSVFGRDDRDVSHGCIRVEHPFELAEFLLGKGHENTVARIRYSMSADVSPVGKDKGTLTEEQRAVADTLRRDMLIGSVKVSPAVPLFIIYFTLFPDSGGQWRTYKDVYGYDEVVYRCLMNYL